jgi:organic hydroperoxide reductase OsmC/OhrA
MKKHQYNSTVTWTGNRGEGTRSYHSYSRDLRIGIKCKPDIEGSADPAFRGDPEKHNPEELFLSSIVACHMLWYLHLCADNGITVVSYSDKATGVMVEEKGGKGRFQSVTLNPVVTILNSKNRDKALNLHKKANEMCFIANSCNFPIKHEAQIQCQDL